MSAEKKHDVVKFVFQNNYNNKNEKKTKQTLTINMFYPLFIYKDKTVQKALKKL